MSLAANSVITCLNVLILESFRSRYSHCKCHTRVPSSSLPPMGSKTYRARRTDYHLPGRGVQPNCPEKVEKHFPFPRAVEENHTVTLFVSAGYL